MAAVLVTARLCEPSSELHTTEDWYRRTALAESACGEIRSGNKSYRTLGESHTQSLARQRSSTGTV
jgi:hypothetical protein